MNIERLFKNLSINRELIFYLFEHRDKVVYLSEIEEYCKESTLEVLENFEILELSDDKLFLDGRVINFLEEYLEGSDNIEISVVTEKILALKHKIEILKEHSSKQKEFIPKIRKELKKCDFVLFQNLDKLRIHVDRVYKSVDKFSLKIKELKYYQRKLEEFSSALEQFDKFILFYYPILKSFYNSELNLILEIVNQNKILLNKNLIPLTQDVIEYINQAINKNIFIEKITKLKEYKDSLELKQKTNLFEIVNQFDLQDKPIRISTVLDGDIKYDENFSLMVQKLSSKSQLKIKQTTSIKFHSTTFEKEFLNIHKIHLQFSSSNLSLIEFLLQNNKFQDKQIDEISEVYCKMALLYEEKYKISDDKIVYNNTTFRRIYYDNKHR